MRVADPSPAVIGSYALIFATTCLVVYTLHAIYLELVKLDANENATTESACEETDENDSEQTEAGVSQGSESPAEEAKVEETDSAPFSASPWSSILSIGSGTLCGAETVEEASTLETTAQENFDKLASLAIAAGVDRSEVSQLTQSFSKQLSYNEV